MWACTNQQAGDSRIGSVLTASEPAMGKRLHCFGHHQELGRAMMTGSHTVGCLHLHRASRSVVIISANRAWIALTHVRMYSEDELCLGRSYHMFRRSVASL